jgi:aminopeptidase N
VSSRLEQTLLSGIQSARGTSLKSAYFNALRRTVTSREGLAYLERVWRQRESIPGLTFAEADYISMAEALALRQIPATEAVLKEQRARITNPDRRARFAFIAPALSPDAASRDGFFSSLTRPENRAHEPWVIDALRFLNHPLRRDHAERYIEPSLELLSEIHRTGDIFFPSRWTAAVLSGHNSTSAATIVTTFLARQKDYPPRLRQIIDQASDLLFRAARATREPRAR